jgi:ABC-2 type transport system permease protein
MMQSGTFAAALAAETRGEVLKTVRMPVFIIPVLAFPAVFYGLFGILISTGPAQGGAMAAYLLASYGTFGVIGAALFGLGVGVATERGQGWLLLKRATPMPPLAYFAAKAIMSMLIGGSVIALLAAMATIWGGVRLPPISWVLLSVTLLAGAVPFCAMGCMIGFAAGPNSAPMVANLIYLPMSLASGLWLPIEALPDVMQRFAVVLPPYHLAQLALGIVRGVPVNVMLHATTLAAFTVVFLAAAVFGWRRDDGRTWG